LVFSRSASWFCPTPCGSGPRANWQDSQKAQIEQTGIPPSNAKESAIVASLPPGAYTAIVRGANNTVGNAVVEVYNLP
jgi:hypothetical protein